MRRVRAPAAGLARNFRPQMTGMMGIIHRIIVCCESVAATEIRRRPDFGLAVAERSGDTALAPGGAGTRGSGPPPAPRSPEAIRRDSKAVSPPLAGFCHRSKKPVDPIRSFPVTDAARSRAPLFPRHEYREPLPQPVKNGYPEVNFGNSPTAVPIVC